MNGFEGRGAGREGYRNNMVVYCFGNGCGVDGWLSGCAWLSCFALFRMVLKKKENVFLGGKGGFEEVRRTVGEADRPGQRY